MANYTQKMATLVQAADEQLRARSTAEIRIAALVNEMKEEGMSWVQVGTALGTSGQAAWERYGLTAEQRAERSRGDRGCDEQGSLPGLEGTMAERINARQVALKKQRAKEA